MFGAVAALAASVWPVPAHAASAKDCIAFEEGDADDALTYRNDCNRTVFFYYCVVDPQRSEVAPCKRIIFGTRRVLMQGSRGQLFLTREMDPNSSTPTPPTTSSCGAAARSNGRPATPSSAASNRSRPRAMRRSIFPMNAAGEDNLARME